MKLMFDPYPIIIDLRYGEYLGSNMLHGIIAEQLKTSAVQVL
jgi:hypothetical protein